MKGETMKRNMNINGIEVYIGNFTPRHNEYERGLKYRVYIDSMPTSYVFSTIHEAKSWVQKNIWLFY